jgi:aldehyde:ferredoxin oxidoreductase
MANPPRALCYITENRVVCHLNINDVVVQNTRAMLDSIGLCLFPTFEPALEEPVLSLLSAITGREYDKAEFSKVGEKFFNLEKMFNYCEGFSRKDTGFPIVFSRTPSPSPPKRVRCSTGTSSTPCSHGTTKIEAGTRTPLNRVNPS